MLKESFVELAVKKCLSSKKERVNNGIQWLDKLGNLGL